jgi:anti-sigma regulatory factor (Ser/Thr protein kinase)
LDHTLLDSPVDAGGLRLTIPARAENVVLARRAVQELSVKLGLPERLVEDIRLAVTEACTNVVRHAYAEAGGALTLRVHPREPGILIEVLDAGCGESCIRSGDSAGLGLPLIAALSQRHEIELPPGGGRVVRMYFAPRTGRFIAS